MAEPRAINSRADLEDYVAAFNARDYARQIAYYAPDVRYAVGTAVLESPAAIAAFYDDFHDHVREHVRIAAFAMTGDTVAVAIPTTFEPYRDYRKHGLEFVAGEPREIVTLAFYQLREGRIRRIRMARYAGQASDFDNG